MYELGNGTNAADGSYILCTEHNRWPLTRRMWPLRRAEDINVTRGAKADDPPARVIRGVLFCLLQAPQ